VKSRLDVGAVIRRVFEIYFDQASVLMPAAATVFVFSGLLSIVLASAGQGARALSLLVGLIATWIFTAMVVELVSDLQDGKRDATAGQLVRTVVPVIGQVMVVAIVAAIGVLIGFVFFVVPALVLVTYWSVAVPVIVVERPPGLAALGRSWQLVRGHGWQVFGVIVLFVVALSLLVGGIDYAAESAGTGVGLVVTVVLGVLTQPIPALGAAVLYFALRERGGQASSQPPRPEPPHQPDQPEQPEQPEPAEQPNPFGEER
jgi:hypothetical protein